MSNKENSIFSPSKQLMADKLVSGQPKVVPATSKTEQVPSDLLKPAYYVIKTMDGLVELIPFQRFVQSKDNYMFYLMSRKAEDGVYHSFIALNDGTIPVVNNTHDSSDFTMLKLDPITTATMNPITVDGHPIQIGDWVGYDYPNRQYQTSKLYGQVKGYFCGQWVLISIEHHPKLGYTIVPSNRLFKG